MEKQLKGQVAWIFSEENFDVDRIIGVQNIRETNIENLVQVCMTEYDTGFVNRVKEGDWIIGGKNFGYGHPHKPPMLVLRHLGIRGVIAESFSPGFYRGQIADGVPLLKCDEILKRVNRGDTINVDWDHNIITNKTQNTVFNFHALPSTDKKIIEDGGHVNYLKERMGI